MSEQHKTCERCGLNCIDQDQALCKLFGIGNVRLVATGFVLYDPTLGDVPDMDSCDRADCPGIRRQDAA